MSRADAKGFFKGFVIGIIVVLTVIGLSRAVMRVISEEARRPAAIDKARIFDVSYLSGGALKQASAKQLLQSADVRVADQVIDITLGHFVAKGPQGDRRLLCDIYDNVELSFEAEGIAVNGMRPRLTVVAPCLPSENLNKLNPIKIPYKELLSMKPVDGELSLGGYAEQMFKTTGLGGQWPDYWVLSEVKLTNRIDSSVVMSFDRREVYLSSSRPVVMYFKK